MCLNFISKIDALHLEEKYCIKNCINSYVLIMQRDLDSAYNFEFNHFIYKLHLN